MVAKLVLNHQCIGNKMEGTDKITCLEKKKREINQYMLVWHLDVRCNEKTKGLINVLTEGKETESKWHPYSQFTFIISNMVNRGVITR